MKKSVVLLLMVMVCFVSADAQILKKQKQRAAERAKRKTEQKAQQKTDKKVDEVVDDAFQSIGNLFKKKKKKNEEVSTETDYEQRESTNEDEQEVRNPNYAAMMGNKSASDVGLPNNYDFDLYVKCKITTTNKRGKEETVPFNYLFPTDNSQYIGYEVENQSIGIIDIEREKIVSIIKEQNMATVMDMNTIMEVANKYGSESTNKSPEKMDDVKFTKTGKTKVIAGHKCEQFLIETDEMNGEIWNSTDFNQIDFSKLGGVMGQMTQQDKNMKLPKEYADYMKSGFMFEGIFQEKDSKEKTRFLVESLEQKKQNINMEKYQIMDVSQFMKR